MLCSPPKKYKGFRIADTGVDPYGTYLEFIKKDVVRNIDVHRDSDSQRLLQTMQPGTFKKKWAIGCTKHTREKVDEEGILRPEFSGLLRRSNSSYQPIRLKTDNIGFRAPEQPLGPKQKEFDLQVTTP